MFDIDNWIEIFSTVKKNKLRTFLTGFSVAWGIFMLIVLLASGNGLQNGVTEQFGSRAKNSMVMWTRPTSKPYKGNPKDRRIQFDQKDFDLISQLAEVEHVSASVGFNAVASYNFESSDCSFEGVYPSQFIIDGMKILNKNGRFINDIDMKERRKVAVINKRLREVLFKNEDPVGKSFEANKMIFKVIGVYEADEWGTECRAYVPFATAQLLFTKGWGIGSMALTLQGLNTVEANKAFEKKLRAKLAALHQFDPEDERAIGIWNMLENYLETMGIFGGIRLFILVIGIGTLIAGVVGVSNIMLITVRERTREFGIRKALGATPLSILQLVLMESILITSVFGYIGMVLGVGLSEGINFFMESASTEGEPSIFKNPTVSISIALGATVLMVIAGVVAGYFPARKAVKITAVEAMRAE